MKVLQVNCVYKKGSTGKITYDLHKGLLDAGIESVVCYGRGELVKEPGVYKTCSEWYSKLNNALSRVTGIMYGGCFFSTNRLISIIKKEKPDVVHLQCINGYFVNIYRLVTWLKKNHIKTVLTLHAEFMYTANCGHALECDRWKSGCGNCPRRKAETKSILIDGTACSWKRMRKSIQNNPNMCVIGCSKWIVKRASQSLMLNGYDIQSIANGIDLHNFYPQNKDFSYLYKKYGLSSDKVIVLHVSQAFNYVKGTDILLRISNKIPDNMQVVVVGKSDVSSEKVKYIPFTKDQKELADLYRLSSVCITTSRAENYPTICLEANCCGTPVVGFDVGGVKEAIGQGMGEVVKPFDEDQMILAIKKWSQIQIDSQTIQDRIEYCSQKRMVNDYIQLYVSLFQK